MRPDDRAAIASLFDRLTDAERQAPSRDGEAEAMIRRRIADQPSAPYYMAQTIVAQEQALAEAERRIAALEAQAVGRAESGGRPAPASGGGFLAGAAQTALAVAGGVLVGGAIAGGIGAAAAAAPQAHDPQADPHASTAADGPAPEEPADLDGDAGADLDADAGGFFDFLDFGL